MTSLSGSSWPFQRKRLLTFADVFQIDDNHEQKISYFGISFHMSNFKLFWYSGANATVLVPPNNISKHQSMGEHAYALDNPMEDSSTIRTTSSDFRTNCCKLNRFEVLWPFNETQAFPTSGHEVQPSSFRLDRSCSPKIGGS